MKRYGVLFAILATLVVLGINGPVYARMVGNQGGGGFAGPESAARGTQSLETYIIKGGTAFMKCQANVADLSQKIEISDLEGINYNDLFNAAHDGLYNIYNAWFQFAEFNRIAATTPYNDAFIEKLKRFDYAQLQEEQGLNPHIFEKVSSYLKKGDLRNAYTHLTNEMADAYWLIHDAKASLLQGNLPQNRLIWDINQKLASIHLYGQYMTRVFDSLK